MAAMRRRKFLTLLGGVAVACPLAARAQQASKRPTVAFIQYSALIKSPRIPAFAERLREVGWIDGRTVAIEYQLLDRARTYNAEDGTQNMQAN